MSFNLTKQTKTFNLTKNAGNKDNLFEVSLQWSLNSIPNQVNLDVDLMAIPKINGKYSNIKQTCYYNNKRIFDGAVYLTRDDQEGGKGEEIYIDPSKLPSHVEELLIFITFYSNRRNKSHILENLNDLEFKVKGMNSNKEYVTTKDLSLSGVTHSIVSLIKDANQDWFVRLEDKTAGNVTWEKFISLIMETNQLSNDQVVTEEQGFFSKLFDFLF